MDKKTVEQFKQRLLKEKALLEKELGKVGRRDTTNPGGWDATSGDIDVDPADDTEVANKMEELEDNDGIVSKLEGQLKEVKDALIRIEKGVYGICEVSGKPIEIERLEANPSARTSIKNGR